MHNNGPEKYNKNVKQLREAESKTDNKELTRRKVQGMSDGIRKGNTTSITTYTHDI